MHCNEKIKKKLNFWDSLGNYGKKLKIDFLKKMERLQEENVQSFAIFQMEHYWRSCSEAFYGVSLRFTSGVQIDMSTRFFFNNHKKYEVEKLPLVCFLKI